VEVSLPTPFKSFVSRWENGCESALCPKAKNVCLARGSVPFDVVFVGEAPSIAADIIGQPFIGEIRSLIEQAMEKASWPGDIRCVYTNAVGCVPRNPNDSAKVVPPPEDAIRSCQPRLREFLLLCEPKLIIAVGLVAKDSVNSILSADKTLGGIPVEQMIHPSKILRVRPYGGYEFGLIVTTLRKALGHLKPRTEAL
jgi:uracil-DNA glycosylase family 4